MSNRARGWLIALVFSALVWAGLAAIALMVHDSGRRHRPQPAATHLQAPAASPTQE